MIMMQFDMSVRGQSVATDMTFTFWQGPSHSRYLFSTHSNYTYFSDQSFHFSNPPCTNKILSM